MPLGLLFGALARLQEPNIDEIDRLARAKDTAALSKLLATPVEPTSIENPFTPMRLGGVYGVGRYGWRALLLAEPSGDRRFVVFSTPLTSEDTGELLFELRDGKLTYIPEDDRLGLTVKRHRFDIRFKTATKIATLQDRVALACDPGGLKVLRFGPQYRVDAIRGHAFSQAGGVVLVNLPEGASTLDIRYHAKVDLPIYAAGISKDEFTLTNDYWYPMVGRWPAGYDMTLHVPHGWSVAAQGRYLGVKRSAKEDVWTTRMDLPVCYYSVSAFPTKVHAQRVHGRTYRVWSPVDLGERAKLQGPIYAGIVEFYDKAFGGWPFEGYGAVVSPSYGGGALEAYSYATYGGRTIPGEDAHEPSHTIWGGVIPNTYLHSLWNEAFADFSDGLYHRNAPIGNVEDRRLAFVSHPAVGDSYKVVAVSKGSAFVGPAGSSLGYGKGAEVLAMLEDEIGTPQMVAAMRHWVKTHPVGTPGEWDQFEASVNETTGKDFGWFFAQWLDRPGYAEFSVTNARYEGGEAKLDWRFTGAPYRMTVEVLLGLPNGVTDLRRVVVPAEGASTIAIKSAQRPNFISIDPYRRLIRRIDPSERPLSVEMARARYKPYAEGSDLRGVIVSAVTEAELTRPLVRQLCAEAGFTLQGFSLSHRGTTIDLRHGQAMAVLSSLGKQVLLVLGKSEVRPATGDADVALTDRLGRFLCGHTPPKTTGALVFPLGD
jgi:hypothetical protein